MANASAILPNRLLQPLPPIARGWSLRSLIGLLMFGGFLVFSVGWVAPEVVTDWMVRDTAVPIQGARVSDGSCTAKLFFQLCDVTLTAPVGTGTVTRAVHYGFGSFHDGDFTARVVADPQRPEWLTTDLGLNYFWNRVVSLLLDIGLCLALLVGGIIQIQRGTRIRRSWHEAKMVPVPLQLVSQQKVRAGTIWTLKDDNGKTVRWTMPRRAKPFVLGPAADRVLGLMMKGGGSIMPLDAGLRWVTLSKAERSAALAANSRSTAS